jgi:hypothetical protein
MKNNNRVTKNQIRVLLAFAFMTVSAIPGRLISFIPNNFVDQYILNLVPILLVVFLFILLFTLERKTGTVRIISFYKSYDVRRRRPLLFVFMFIVFLPCFIYISSGFLLKGNINWAGYLTSWSEVTERAEIEWHRIGESKRTRGKLGFGMNVKNGEIYKFWIDSEDVYVMNSTTLEAATHAKIDLKKGPLGAFVERVILTSDD